MRGFLSKKEILQNIVEINEYKDVQTNETGCSAVNIQRFKTLSLIDMVVEAQAELQFESPRLTSLATLSHVST